MGNFQKAVRAKSKLRLALSGVSGSGKTLGAFYIAYGLTGDWSKIAVVDTEHERALMYANRGDLGTGEFLHTSLEPPYTTDRYKVLVKEAASIVGQDGVVIVDSFTHAWNNEGGILEQRDKFATQPGKNGFSAWSEAGKLQTNLVNTILAINCHVIVTMRSKMDYVLQLNDKGKQVPVKVGLAPVQREDTEYEFDIALDIERNHIATASKDTTFLDDFNTVITVELGEQLKAWLDDGVDYAIIRGERPITQEQWIAFTKDYKQYPDIVKSAYEAVGYKQAIEIKQKDLPKVIDKANEILKVKEAKEKKTSE